MADPLLDILGVQNAPAPQQEQDPLLSTLGVTAPKQGPPAAVSPSQSASTSMTDSLANTARNIPHALGVGSRAVLEGAGDTLDFLASPLRAAANAVLPSRAPTLQDQITGEAPKGQIQPGMFGHIADLIGLPKPQNAAENIAFAGSKMGAGAMLPIGIGSGLSSLSGNAPVIARTAQQASDLASAAPSLSKGVGTMLGSNPVLQTASGIGSGVAGQGVKEAGGSPGAQFLASLVGGIGVPLAASAGSKLLDMGSTAGKNIANLVQPSNNAQAIDQKIADSLRGSQFDFSQLPGNVRNSIRADVADAMKISGDLSPDAVSRLAAYRLTGTTPTAATVSLSPAVVTQQKNLSKLGINSKDVSAQTLGNVENTNNAKLIGNLNDMGANAGLDSESAGQSLKGMLSDVANQNKQAISGLYNTARDSQGRAAQINSQQFAQDAGDALHKSNLEAFLPAEVRQTMNKISDGSIPLTVDTAEQFKTIIGNAQRSSNDGNARAALGAVRNALDNAPLVPGQKGIGQESIDAFNQARQANRQFMQTVEKTPSLGAAIDDASPKGFFESHVVNGDSNSLKNTLGVLQDNPQALPLLRNQTLAWLKGKALGGAADEVGNLSGTRYNAALRVLGNYKLNMLFSPEEVAQLQAVGKVASYDKFQPVGSAVNNSNTAAAGMGQIFNMIGSSPLLSKIPFGKQLAEPAQNIATGMQSQAALNIPNALISAPLQTNAPRGLLMSPVLPLGGLNLDANADEKKKKLGLLATP